MDYGHMGAENRTEGKRYIFVVEDRFSRWVEAVATSKEDARSAAKFLCREVIPRFGIPDFLSSDNGAHFVNQTIELITKALGMEHKLGCVYHPQSQGMVERANGILKSKLEKICASSRLTWVQALPLALLKMHSQTSRITHLTPHEMLTGRPMPLAFTRAPYTGPPLEQLENEMQNYVRALTRIHRHLYSHVRDAVHGEEVPPVRQVEPGDYVWIRVFKRKHALQGRREGPFKVVAATPTAVRVEGRPNWYHLNHCSRGRGKGPLLREPAAEEPSTTSDRPSTSGKTQPTTPVSSDTDSGSEEDRSPAQGTRVQAKCRAQHRTPQPTPTSDEGSSENSPLDTETPDSRPNPGEELQETQHEELSPDTPLGPDALADFVQSLSDPAQLDPSHFETIDFEQWGALDQAGLLPYLDSNQPTDH